MVITSMALRTSGVLPNEGCKSTMASGIPTSSCFSKNVNGVTIELMKYLNQNLRNCSADTLNDKERN